MHTKPTLFLDRDGVINQRPSGDYVKHPDAFIPVLGAFEAIRIMTGLFDRIVVVTNQAGIGKGLMEVSDLYAVHQKMRALAAAAGGRIDGVYYCPHRSEDACACRKPATGMALAAKTDFPDIEFSNAWMVGDSASDMVFGQTLGMKTVLIRGKWEETELLAEMAIDYRFDSLLDFARFFQHLEPLRPAQVLNFS